MIIFQKFIKITLIMKNISVITASIHHMIKRAFIFDSCWSWHGINITLVAKHCKIGLTPRIVLPIIYFLIKNTTDNPGLSNHRIKLRLRATYP